MDNLIKGTVFALLLLLIALGTWFALGPKPPEKNLPQYTVHIVAIREYSTDQMVSIANQGPDPVDISGWTLWAHQPKPDHGFAYHFPDGCVLNGFQMVRVHSGGDALSNSGTKCEGKTPDLFWTSDGIWCQANGDTAYLYDAKDNPADRYVYGGEWHLSAVVPCAPGG